MNENAESLDKYKHLAYDRFPKNGLKQTEHVLLNDIPDPIEVSTEKLFQEETHDRIISVMKNNLYPRDQLVLRLYYGLDGDEPKTFEEIGKILGISSERVRKLAQRGERYLRHPKVPHRLYDMFEQEI